MPKTVIISDLHLGSPLCRKEEVLSFLQSLPDEDRLIINGDIYHDPNPRRLARDMSDTEKEIERRIMRRDNTIFLFGNHDKSQEFLSRMLKREVYSERAIVCGEKRFLIVHGHRFDIIAKPEFLVIKRAIGNFFSMILFWHLRRRQVTMGKFLATLKTAFEDMYRKLFPLKYKAVRYARKLGFTGIFVGHNHFAETDLVGGVYYYNSGAWVGNRECTYITITESEVALYVFTMGAPPSLRARIFTVPGPNKEV